LAIPALLAVLALPSGAAQAAPAATTFVTMVSEIGDYIGQGADMLWRPGDGSVTVSGTVSGAVTVSVSGGASGTSFDLTFAAAPGASLVDGTYTGAERTPFRTAGHPGIDISGEGRGCNTDTGRFTVLDVAPDLSRLWLVYEQHCEGSVPALFGEVRYNEPGGDSALLVAPDHIAWPSEYPGVGSRIVPVNVVNTGTASVTVSGAAVTTGQSNFSVVSNGCATIAVGASCTVYVQFWPTSPGGKSGTLTVSESGGGSHTVALSGSGIAGFTSWAMESQAGDYIGAGQYYAYTPANATISARGSDTFVEIDVTSGDAWWSADFEADSSRLLLPGTTFSGATRYPFNSPSTPGLDVEGSGRGCNTLTGTFTVHDATYRGGVLTGISITFEQHCEGATPALFGSIAWHSPSAPAALPGGVGASTLGLSSSPALVTYGSTASLRGRLLDAHSGTGLGNESIALFTRKHGATAWSYLGTALTHSDGRYSYTIAPRLNRDYLADFDGSDHTGSAAGPIEVKVAPWITLTANRYTGAQGSTFVLSTSVTPDEAGASVRLQRYYGGAWHTIASRTLSTSSRTSFSVRPRTVGYLSYRVLRPASGGRVAGTSPAVKLHVT
jgi:hypothetical protein